MAEIIRDLQERRKRIFSLVRKELDYLFKDKTSVFILFFIPIICITTVGMSETGSLGFMGGQSEIWVLDFDDTDTSHEVIETLNASESLVVRSNHEDPEVTLPNAQEELPKTQLKGYIIIGPGFETQLRANGSVNLTVYLDAINFITRLSTWAAIQLALSDYQINHFVFERDVFYFPVLEPEESINILEMAAPILIGMVLYATINLASSQAIVGDIPLKRLLTTPAYRAEVIIAKTLAYCIVGVFQILITVVMIKYIFPIKIYCTIFDLVVHLLLVSLAGTVLGIFFSCVSKTRLQASQMFLFVFIMMLLLEIQVRVDPLLRFIPMEQSALGFANLAYRGGTLADVWEIELNLVLFCTVLFVLSIVYFARKKELV